MLPVQVGVLAALRKNDVATLVMSWLSCRHCHMHSHMRGVNVKRLRQQGVANGGKSRAGQVAWWHCTVLPDLGIQVPQWWTLGK